MKISIFITALFAFVFGGNAYSQKYFTVNNFLNDWEKLQYMSDIRSYYAYFGIKDDVILKLNIKSITKIKCQEKVLLEGNEEYLDRWIYDTLGNFIKRETWFLNYHLSKDTLEQKIPPEPLKVSYIKYNNEGYYIGDSTVVFGHMSFWEESCKSYVADSSYDNFSNFKLIETQLYFGTLNAKGCKLMYFYNEKKLISRVEYYDSNNEFLYAYFYEYVYY